MTPKPRHTDNTTRRLGLCVFVCVLLLWLACLPQTQQTQEKSNPANDAAVAEQANPPEPKTTQGSVGATCQRDDTCKKPLTCETRIPNGYCTKSCIKTTDCPSRSACVRIKFKDGATFLRCLRTCYTNEDCRRGFYCYHPPGAWKLICLPNEAKPQP